jgi:hypothetical protein
MAVALKDGASVGLAAVDAGNYKALRVASVPMNSLAWNSVGAESGALTGVAAAGLVFSLRNIGTNILVVRRVGVTFVTTTAFTTAQRMAFDLIVKRSFSASDTTGTAIVLTADNAKLKKDLAAVTNIDARIAAAAALTAGTGTLDTNPLAVVSGWSGAVGQGILPNTADNLFRTGPEDHPIILKVNEGINIRNVVAMGAAGVGVLSVNFDVAELVTTGL